jgi:energy-coupling factor transporter ATP-binding protein EcfA2
MEQTSGPKLKVIRIEGLFGAFDYTLSLFTEDRITILLGQNGLGKTTLLRMLNDFFEGNYSELAMYIFSTLKLSFSDGTQVEITKPVEQQKLFGYESDVGGSLLIRSSAGDEWKVETLSADAVARFFRSMPPTEPFRQLRNQLVHGGKLSISLLREFEERSPRGWARLMEMTHQEEPDWLNSIRERFPTKFIPSDRLNPGSLPIDEEDDSRRRRQEPVLSHYAKLVAGRIGKTIDTYADRSQSLDRSFLRRLASRLRQTDLQEASSSLDISVALSTLEESRKRISEYGLLDVEAGLDFLRPEEVGAVPLPVVELHVNDNIEKLQVFSDLARRIELLYRISRQRLRFKRVAIDKVEGLVVSARDPRAPGMYDKRLRLADLSSGEQHHLVLLTKLLFDVPKNSLVLIDEPEISMHIVWQYELLRDLKSIADHIDADLLIATHSSQIIGEYLEQTIPLDEQVSFRDEA